MSKNYLKFSQSNPYSARHHYECNYVFMRSVLVLFPLSTKTDFRRQGLIKIPKKCNEIPSNRNKDALCGLIDRQTDIYDETNWID
jgi:hypothetical protein